MASYLASAAYLVVVLALFTSNLLAQRETALFASISQLQMLVTAEKTFVKRLEETIQHEQKLLNELKAFHGHLSSNLWSSESLDYGEQLQTVKDPFATFVNLYRIVGAWNNLPTGNRHLSKAKQDFQDLLSRYRTFLPTYKDLEGSANAIFRLQETYRLTARFMFNRFLTTYHTPAHKVRHALYSLARHAYTYEDYINAKMWLDLALPLFSKAVDENNNETVTNFIDVLDHLVFIEFKLGNASKALSYAEEILVYDPNHVRAQENVIALSSVLRNNNQHHSPPHEARTEKPDGYDRAQYNTLCRVAKDSTEQSPSRLHGRLKCYQANHHPILAFKPIPYEVVSVDPYIVIYHDVIRRNELAKIKELAYKKLKRASVTDHETGAVITADYRICKSGWLMDDEADVLVELNQRLEAVTGLSSSTAESLQVGNYGIGGHYAPHFDWSRNFSNSDIRAMGTGDRIATVLLYMSDVESGGATVFMGPSITIHPRQGSAVFWYNLHRNGKGDQNTQHAACPVLYGEKWVANKWFHEVGQEFRRPCSLKSWE